jgi:hypothetical protein
MLHRLYLDVPDFEEPTSIPYGCHYGVAVDERGFHRVVALRDYARAPEMLPEKYRTPREAIRRSEEMERQRG